MAAKLIFSGEVIEEKFLQQVQSVAGSISWSKDDRIAVICDQGVYVFSLEVSEKHRGVAYTLSCIPCDKEVASLTKINDGQQFFSQALDAYGTQSVGLYLESTVISSSMIKTVAWSPPGCDREKRCIFASLSMDFKIKIHFCSSNSWQEATELSSAWQSYCKETCYFDTYNKSSGICDFQKVTVKTLPLINKCLKFIQFTTLVWCAELFMQDRDSSEASNKFSVLTAATRSGIISFWKVPVPVDSNTSASLIGTWDTHMEWPCSMDWLASSQHEGLLAVGDSSGLLRVFRVRIGNSSIADGPINVQVLWKLWDHKDEMAINSIHWSPLGAEGSMYLFASKTSSIIRFTIPENGTDTSHRHEIIHGIHQDSVIALDACANGSVFSCDSTGTVQRVAMGTLIPEELQLETNRRTPCYGLGVSSNGLYTVLVRSTDINTASKANVLKSWVQFISLVDESTLSAAIKTATITGTLSWDVRQALRHYVHQQDVPVPAWPLMDQPLDSLNIASLRIRYCVVQQLNKKKASPEDEAINDGELEVFDCIFRLLALERLTSWLDYYEGKGKECPVADRTCALIAAEWLLLNLDDARSLSLATRTYRALGHTALAAQATQIRKDALVVIDEDDDELKEPGCKKVKIGKVEGWLNREPAVSSPHNGRNTRTPSSYTDSRLPIKESCPICKSEVPLTDLRRGVCTSGHSWLRCAVSFCICAEFKYHVCIECRGCVSTGNEETSTWLRRLLRRTDCCPVCGNWLS
ncbi:general transcription factor 3C polypeptide 4 [Nematostella vectensis]|uniref:general transcription factor 3C polypeptide 4 n=1 Tax=Nematostella vectensis TaxID=45351 RepID=UPI00138FA4E5|nr:general transcription factor 3C polypeptide 4 [Nematostella vectensis]